MIVVVSCELVIGLSFVIFVRVEKEERGRNQPLSFSLLKEKREIGRDGGSKSNQLQKVKPFSGQLTVDFILFCFVLFCFVLCEK